LPTKPLTERWQYVIENEDDYDEYCHSSTSYHRGGALRRRSACCPLIVVVSERIVQAVGSQPAAFFVFSKP
jgi:hypothetical protein